MWLNLNMWLKLIALTVIWIACWLIERERQRNVRGEEKIWPLCASATVTLCGDKKTLSMVYAVSSSCYINWGVPALERLWICKVDCVQWWNFSGEGTENFGFITQRVTHYCEVGSSILYWKAGISVVVSVWWNTSCSAYFYYYLVVPPKNASNYICGISKHKTGHDLLSWACEARLTEPMCMLYIHTFNNKKKTPWLLVRKRIIPAERPPHNSEVSANFCG
jgi:hypothetical protein